MFLYIYCYFPQHFRPQPTPLSVVSPLRAPYMLKWWGQREYYIYVIFSLGPAARTVGQTTWRHSLVLARHSGVMIVSFMVKDELDIPMTVAIPLIQLLKKDPRGGERGKYGPRNVCKNGMDCHIWIYWSWDYSQKIASFTSGWKNSHFDATVSRKSFHQQKAGDKCPRPYQERLTAFLFFSARKSHAVLAVIIVIIFPTFTE